MNKIRLPGYFLMLVCCPPLVSQVLSEQTKIPLSGYDERVTFLGWADLLYRDNGVDPTFFNIQHIYGSVNWNISSSWQAFLELEYEKVPAQGDEPEDSELIVDRAWIEYRHSSAARFRLGKIHSPAGIWKPQHWALVVDTISKPIMEDNGYIPFHSEALVFFGTRVLERGELNYTVLIANVEEKIGTRHRLDDARAGGLDLNYVHPNRLKFGLSVYDYRNREGSSSSITGVLPYLELYLFEKRLLWRTEYLWLNEPRRKDIRTWYSKLKYRFTPRHYLNLRYDTGLDERRAGGAEHTSETLTYSWWPNEKVRLKFELESNSFENNEPANNNNFSLWAGYIFK